MVKISTLLVCCSRWTRSVHIKNFYVRNKHKNIVKTLNIIVLLKMKEICNSFYWYWDVIFIIIINNKNIDVNIYLSIYLNKKNQTIYLL